MREGRQRERKNVYIDIYIYTSALFSLLETLWPQLTAKIPSPHFHNWSHLFLCHGTTAAVVLLWGREGVGLVCVGEEGKKKKKTQKMALRPFVIYVKRCYNYLSNIYIYISIYPPPLPLLRFLLNVVHSRVFSARFPLKVPCVFVFVFVIMPQCHTILNFTSESHK